jgi:alpha-beta hydrolase superfamily lysophospholipase
VAVASEQAVETRIDSVLQASNGESIALSVWPAKGRERGVILGVHGFGDYGLSTFAMAAEEWREAGLTVYAYDQRGFGRNPSNGVWPGADRLVEDLGVVTDHVRLREGDAPLTVVGHSMGGAVVTAALGEGRIAPDRAVLLAPALWGGENLGIGYRALATMAVTLFPDKRWSGNGVVRIRATDNIEVLRSISRDPLYVRNPSSREFAGLIALMDRAVASAPTVGVPTLVLFGTQDEVVPEEPTRETAALFAGPTEFRIMESGWHLLLRDLEGGRVRDAVADYALGAPLSRVARTSTKARIPGER